MIAVNSEMDEEKEEMDHTRSENQGGWRLRWRQRLWMTRTHDGETK